MTKEMTAKTKRKPELKLPRTNKTPDVSGNENGILKNVANAELEMIRRLAGNDANVRKATIKKLRKWLAATTTKFSDTMVADEREHLDGRFARVWKALFYCMWMADKALAQEALAEQISNLLSIFSDKPKLMILFVEWFFSTFAREWPWIDRLRLDKFMMLIRRFLRRMLQEFLRHDWNDELLDQFLKVLAVQVFNRHPTLSKKAAKKCPDPPKAPLGFQIHIVNIFLEELAKVGGSTMESEKILKILSPFINEIAENDDDRLLEEIKSRVFHHLMKQSDVGIDYVESRGGTMELIEIDDDGMEFDDEFEKDHETAHTQSKVVALDPRAGQVDVVLPQLNIEYEALIDRLKAAANDENVKSRNRKIIMSLVREFEKLNTGQFPLGFERESSRIPAVNRSEVESAAQRLLKLEEVLKEGKARRGDKKRRKKGKKKLEKLSQSGDSGNGSTAQSDDRNGSNEDNHISHVDLNLTSQLEPEKDSDRCLKQAPTVADVESHSKRKQNGINTTNNTIPRSKRVSDSKISDAIKNGDTPQGTPSRLRGKRNSAGFFTTESSANSDKTSILQKKIETKSTVDAANGVHKHVEENPKNPGKAGSEGDGDTFVVIKRRRLSDPHIRLNVDSKPTTQLTKREISTVYSSIKTQLLASPTISKEKKSTPKVESVGQPRSPMSHQMASSQKKKVNFVLAKNLEHAHSDYQASIQRSPAIPYDGTKLPGSGLLKTMSPKTPVISQNRKFFGTPVGVGHQRRSMGDTSSKRTPLGFGTNSIRKRASDFF